MKLIHYTSNSELHLQLDKNYVYRQENSFKPNGFWLSCETEIEEEIEENKNNINWFQWATEENFRLNQLAHVYEIELVENANILRLESVEEILKFNEDFKYDLISGPGLNLKCNFISWPLVKELFDGIIICPYQWKLRFESSCFWYYSWDCSSGCLWNLQNTIKSVKKLNLGESNVQLEFKLKLSSDST